MKFTDEPYQFWLAALQTPSREKRRRACALAGGAEAFYRMSPEQLAGLHLFTEKEADAVIKAQRECSPEAMWMEFLRTSGRSGMRFIPFDSPDYPERLRHIYNAPVALFVTGRLPDEEKKSIAVVGARTCSEYGRSIAHRLGRTMAKHGVQVISGMAAGVDSAAHAGALASGGDTFAVLGCGCDVCYPRISRNIYENIAGGGGGILSELLPGTQPQPWFFPMRNRIIAALADIVIIAEARERSGSLITADFALEQGKDVWAVPGRCLDNLSVGCNRLIEQGAGIFVDMDSFLLGTGIVTGTKNKREGTAPPTLFGEEKLVYDHLGLEAKYLDSIAEESGLDLLTVLDALDTLKRKNLAQETFQNYFCKKL